MPKPVKPPAWACEPYPARWSGSRPRQHRGVVHSAVVGLETPISRWAVEHAGIHKSTGTGVLLAALGILAARTSRAGDRRRELCGCGTACEHRSEGQPWQIETASWFQRENLDWGAGVLGVVDRARGNCDRLQEHRRGPAVHLRRWISTTYRTQPDARPQPGLRVRNMAGGRLRLNLPRSRAVAAGRSGANGLSAAGFAISGWAECFFAIWASSQVLTAAAARACSARLSARRRALRMMERSSATLPQQASLKCTSGRPGRGIASCRSAIAGALGRRCLRLRCRRARDRLLRNRHHRVGASSRPLLGSVRVGWLIEFAEDSPLEQRGFELSVPPPMQHLPERLPLLRSPKARFVIRDRELESRFLQR